ncbi:Quercetin 2,3-dioxygenase [compost metagenome]
MSTHETRHELSSSYDCPLNEGVRSIQRVVPRGAEVGGGLSVNRLLPSQHRRMVGAWCFLDHAGPATFKTGGGLRVGPHPHIGLQTFTWMIEGEVLHRDSLGNTQTIRPGQVNLMTAGYGISHTEESLPGQQHLHAVQLWIALPAAVCECAPQFIHYPDLPHWLSDGFNFTLLAGRFGQYEAPTDVYSSIIGLDIAVNQAGATKLNLDPTFEYGVLPLGGEWRINGETFAANELAYLGRGLESLALEASNDARAIVLGGEPFAEEIFLWWNFVGHSKEQIAQAHRAWLEHSDRFGEVLGFDGARLTAPVLPW